MPDRARLLLAALALAVALPASPGGATAEPESAPAATKPLVWQSEVADPSVVETDVGYLAVGTGPGMSRLRARGAQASWRVLSSPMPAFPSWVLSGDIWAPDLARVPGGWALYYSALTAGLPAGGRCIGVATSPTPSGPFVPVGDTPLVCPPRAGLAPAEDQLLERGLDMPAGGVIDASLFTERDGRQYLLYKTQGRPSSIRMIQLTPDGLHVVPGKQSRELVRSSDIVENPTLVHQGSHYVLFTSEGWYGDCDYRTTYRKSRRKWAWPARSTNMLGPVITRLCGPAGADVVEPRAGGLTRMFFHGWTCYQTSQPCPRTFRRDRDDSLVPRRAMYGVLLDWGRSDSPQIVDYLMPR